MFFFVIAHFCIFPVLIYVHNKFKQLYFELSFCIILTCFVLFFVQTLHADKATHITSVFHQSRLTRDSEQKQRI